MMTPWMSHIQYLLRMMEHKMVDLEMHMSDQQIMELNQSERDLLILKTIAKQQSICADRPGQCEKKFVRIKHVAVATLIVMAFLAGFGIYQSKFLLPSIVKVAVAAALVP